MTALIAGALLVAMGWAFGRYDRVQARQCDDSHARTMAVIRDEHLRLAFNNAALTEELSEAQMRIRHLQDCNSKLAIRAVMASSPINQ